jgi:hypothetical protein
MHPTSPDLNQDRVRTLIALGDAGIYSASVVIGSA